VPAEPVAAFWPGAATTAMCPWPVPGPGGGQILVTDVTATLASAWLTGADVVVAARGWVCQAAT
jgi:hypothetical protein